MADGRKGSEGELPRWKCVALIGCEFFISQVDKESF
jgi:hypothetical protein